MDDNKKYGLFTTITMISGIVIGSGIFFKADDILTYTAGNVLLGILVFIIAAIAIIFGSLSFSMLAQRTDKPGGIISYAEEFINKPMASAFGWFQTFLYLPILVVVVAWVSVMYLCQLFGVDISLREQLLLSPVVILAIFGLNILSAKLGGYFQNLSMIIKLIPLIAIAILGVFKGNPSQILSNDLSNVTMVVSTGGFLGAFAPIAFSFDGWAVATSICNEVKDSKRNLPLALIIAPILILLVYVLYFVGITSLVGPDEVMNLGDESVNVAAKMVFGNMGSKIILVFVVISVLGTCNGLILAMIRMPYSLALRNMVPASNILSKENKSLKGMPLNSAIFALIVSLIWGVLNYILFGMNGIEIDGLVVCAGYLIYIIMYIAMLRLTSKGEIKNKFMGYVVPTMAIIGALIILSGGVLLPYFAYFIIISIVVMGIGYFYCESNK